MLLSEIAGACGWRGMELVLNLLWLAISCAALALWQVRWKHEHSSKRWQSCRAWIALPCVLILLFFPISLTDDLHAELLLIGDCSAQRRSTIAFAGGHEHQASSARSIELLAIFQGGLHLVPSYIFHALVSDETPSRYLSSVRETNDRAPPPVLR
jgi:hypothetical protein